MQLFGSLTDSNPEALAKMYPHLYDTLLEDANTIFKDRIPPERLASIFPTILNSEPLKSCLGADSSKIASELSEALSTALNLSAEGASPKKPASSVKSLPDTQTSAPTAKSHAPVAPANKTTSGATAPKPKPLAPGSGCKGVHHGHSAHAKELNKLLHQHYCKKGAASQASKPTKKGKEATGTAQTSSDTTAEGSEEDSNDDDEEDSCCSSASACTSDSKQCSCCYCEVFGPSGPPMTPVSKKYPEMRDRLRRLLNKKKKQQQQVLSRAPIAPSKPAPVPAPVPAAVALAPGPAPTQCKPVLPSQQQRPTPPAPVKASVPSTKTPAALTTVNPKAPPPSKQLPVMTAPVPVAKPACVDDLLEFIEGGSQCTNEKKKAKKDRQKQQRLAELRQREEEERRRREAEEAERRRREEAERKAVELERQSQKKQKKKAAQKAKKAAASGQSLSEIEDSSAPPSADSSLRLEELRLQQMREIQQLHFKHQRELEEEQRKLEHVLSGKTKDTAAAASSSASRASSGTVSAAAAAAMKASGNSGHVRITRTASGGVEFTPVSSVEARAPTQPQQMASPFASLMPQLDFPLGGMGANYGTRKSVMAPSVPAMSQPPSSTASVPSASKGNQQMVTIKRVLNPSSADSTVTISSCDSSKEKLLYTLINGQIHRSKNAPANLIPTAKLLAESQTEVSEGLNKKQRKKLRRQQQQSDDATMGDAGWRPIPSSANCQPRPPLPVNREGKLDLDRLHLPPGISITKIDGASGERKFFPSRPEHIAPEDEEQQQVFQLPPPQSNLYPSYVTASANGMSSVAGFPSGINNSNVIVVDTSSLKTSEEEMDDDDDDSAQKNKAKRKGRPEEEKALTQAQSGDLKSGPQVLIKNVNGKVVITPIPDSGSACQSEGNDGCCDRPPVTNGSDAAARKAKKGSSKKASIGENIDEISERFVYNRSILT
jgi:hypothetical protein